MNDNLRLIVGLGNPGKEYRQTRHNIGFSVVDAFAQKHGLSFEQKKKAKAKVASGRLLARRVLLAKPQTYMNLSGSAVQGLAAYYHIPPDHILVVFDDLDLPLGTLRIRPKGGSGGHRGMKDIIQRLGTQEFPRIRIGIGRPEGNEPPADYVLRSFTQEEQALVVIVVEQAVSAIETWLREGIETTMNRFNGVVDTRQPGDSAPPPPPAQP